MIYQGRDAIDTILAAQYAANDNAREAIMETVHFSYVWCDELVSGEDTIENLKSTAARIGKVICLWDRSVDDDNAEAAGYIDETGRYFDVESL